MAFFSSKSLIMASWDKKENAMASFPSTTLGNTKNVSGKNMFWLSILSYAIKETKGDRNFSKREEKEKHNTFYR